MPVRRQTQSYLRSLFASRGVVPRRRLGQNFLVDLNIHDVILKAAEVGPHDVVLEVGPGAGALTTLIADRAAAVIAVEVDPALANLTREAVSGRPNVRVLQMDALAGKNKIRPELLDHVRAALAAGPGKRFKLVANLPYAVATPIVTNLLVHPELRPSLIVVTIQLELAERMRAVPETEPYGALSVLIGALGDCDLVRVLPPTVFWPQPKVESAIVKIIPRAEKLAAIPDLAWFHGVVRGVFLHRRKNLRRVLQGLWRERLTLADVDRLLDGLGLTGLVRAEALTVEEFIALASALDGRIRSGSKISPPAG
jgi:16S rRNA (adenine1518-N6/adenine1519-N6)-dimethyltransferase